MNGVLSIAAATLPVLASRVAIGATGLQWMLAGDELRLGVAVVALALTFLPARLIRDSLIQNTTTATISIMLAAHIVLGMQYEFYEKSTVYDKAVHGLGSAAVAGILMLFIQRFCRSRGIKLPVGLMVTFMIAGTLSAGTLWELFEFAIDSTGLFYAQRGLHDTMLDLLADSIGAVLAAVVFAAATYLGACRAAIIDHEAL